MTTYEPRLYDEIVRDLLTTLTGGTVRESFLMPPGDVPILLNQRPVRRISHLEGLIATSAAPDAREIRYRFTPVDFELISTAADPQSLDAIRFREDGRRPLPGTSVTVNYYPIQTAPVPLTDLNVGSVTRTLLETIAREMAMVYLDLDFVYRSAFLDTAEGGALDNVVALVGVRRLPAGSPVARVKFTRRPSTAGRITVPTGTPITTGAGDRYLTSEPLTLEPGEVSREVNAVGEGAATEVVEANQLTLLEVLIAGIAEDGVTNPQPARRLSAPETDEELRRRARAALAGVVRGTNDAVRFGVMSLPGVKDTTITEFPNGVAGEIRLEVAYSDDSADVRAAVARRIEELRPAGVRVLTQDAARLSLDVQVSLTLAGTGVPSAEIAELQSKVSTDLGNHLRSLSPGAKVRRAQLVALVLADARIVDATVSLVPTGQSAVDELQLAAGEVLDVKSITFLPPIAEQVSTIAVTGVVSATIPVKLAAGVTLVEATSAIDPAFATYLATRNPAHPFTVDGLLAAIRDDTRFGAVRAEMVATIESGTTFVQLTDNVGSYLPALNETLQKGTLDVPPREGI